LTLDSTKTVIAITGMPGSGKALASSLAEERNISVFICGDVVREEASAMKIPATPENLGSLMLKMRAQYGADVIARRLITKINSALSKTIVIEGLRSLDELKLLREKFDVKLLAIYSPPTQRFQRLVRRGRSDDPKTLKEFNERDNRELVVGVGSVIALADELMVNDSTLEAFKLKLTRFYEETAL
jgi:dephospho-CoA kinase